MLKFRLLALALVVCAAPAFAQEATPEVKMPFLPGYLGKDRLPDSLALLPPPPAADTPAMAVDEADEKAALPEHDTPRWKLATDDNDLYFPFAAGAFSCAAQAPITEADTPTLFRLLRRTISDAIGATKAAKDHYARKRPFLIDKAPMCAPDRMESLAKEGSYPSGHSTTGWAWALILTEIAPDRAEPILARGLTFGESRVVCNVHWQSDVDEGRILAAATVAKLHAEAEFRADLEAAKTEIAAVRARGLPPTRDCAAEAAEMATAP